MTATSNDVANQALQLMGNNETPVTGQYPNFDSSPAGQALQRLYGPCVATVGREFEWDFARSTKALTLSGNTAPFPWAYEYIYPSDCIELWQVMPPALTDANNPLPINWVVANAVVSAQQTRVIQTNLAAALAVYNNYPNENTWDALFREAVVRLLSSELANAIASRPDTSMQLLQSGAAFESIGEARKG